MAATVLVLYHSQEHGNTAAMAEAVAVGVRSTGATVDLVNTNETRLDVEDYRGYPAAAFGTPDYYGYLAGGLKMFLDDWYLAKQANPDGLEGKRYALFFSHGGGGKVKRPFELLFSRLGTKVGDTVASEGEPTAEVLAICRELGRELAEAVGS